MYSVSFPEIFGSHSQFLENNKIICSVANSYIKLPENKYVLWNFFLFLTFLQQLLYYGFPIPLILVKILGIVPFVTTPLKGRFVVSTVAFLLFITTEGGSNPKGLIA